MVWNTIAHPRMMEGGKDPGGLATSTLFPIKFADPHKLSFYDIVMSTTGTIVISLTGETGAKQPILVKGDFETIKKMLLNDEVVCGAIFSHTRDDEGASLVKAEFKSISYNSEADDITLLAENPADLFILYSDNTIEAHYIGGNTGPTSPGTKV